MKKILFSLVAIAALQLSFISSSDARILSSEADTSCEVEETVTCEVEIQFVNCLAARANARRQTEGIAVSNPSTANFIYCLIFSRDTNGSCGDCNPPY